MRPPGWARPPASSAGSGSESRQAVGPVVGERWRAFISITPPRPDRYPVYTLLALKMMSLVDRSWPVLRRMMGAHTLIYRLSGGLIGHRFPGTPPMLLLEHVGAKSGAKRTTPLVYVDDPPNLVLVASKGGHPRNPAWHHN